MKVCGAFLILLGCLALAYQGFGYASHDVSVYDPNAPFSMRTAPLYSVWLPPLAGGLSILAGIAMLAAFARGDSDSELNP